MASTRGERLRAARRHRFRSARAAALALGIPSSTYGAHERAEHPGGRDYGPEEATRYGQRFGVTTEWLLTGLGSEFDLPFAPEAFEPSRKPTIPVVGYVGAGAQAHYYAVSQGHLDEIEQPDLFREKMVILEIRDDDLGPLFNRWRVFFDETRRPVTPDLLGYLCVVGVEGGPIVLRQVRPGRTAGRYNLVAQFGPPLLDAQVEWAARVKTILPP
jgi:hypothetical protein